MATKSKSKRIKYKIGDIFLIPLSTNLFGVGKILLDIFRLKQTGIFMKGNMPEPVINGSIIGAGLLIGYYDVTFTKDKIDIPQLNTISFFTTEFVFHNQIYHGDCSIIGNTKVKHEELDFPEFITRFGATQIYFEKGGIQLPININFNNHEDTILLPTSSFSIIATAENYFFNKENAKKDLRYSHKRNSILKLANFNSTMSYEDMCKKIGSPNREMIIKAAYELQEKNLSLKEIKKK